MARVLSRRHYLGFILPLHPRCFLLPSQYIRTYIPIFRAATDYESTRTDQPTVGGQQRDSVPLPGGTVLPFRDGKREIKPILLLSLSLGRLLILAVVALSPKFVEAISRLLQDVARRRALRRAWHHRRRFKDVITACGAASDAARDAAATLRRRLGLENAIALLRRGRRRRCCRCRRCRRCQRRRGCRRQVLLLPFHLERILQAS